MPGVDPLADLDDVDWSELHAAYGPATVVPRLLRAVIGTDPDARVAAIDELWGTVWHQGTVYEVTPAVVSFLVAIVVDQRLADRTRAEIGMLLASIGAASSFVVDSRSYDAFFARDIDAPQPRVEVDRLCRERLAEACVAIDPVLAAGPPLTQRAAIAVVSTVTPSLSADARVALATLAGSHDPLVATAAGVTIDLAEGAALSATDLLGRAAVDPGSADFIARISDWPPDVQAVELVRELCERSIGLLLSRPRG